eukprot:COSAG02_NODE_26163_length_639_cov_1.048148_1_plen_90_part_10
MPPALRTADATVADVDLETAPALHWRRLRRAIEEGRIEEEEEEARVVLADETMALTVQMVTGGNFQVVVVVEGVVEQLQRAIYAKRVELP